MLVKVVPRRFLVRSSINAAISIAAAEASGM
jgi:hypothetical protein